MKLVNRNFCVVVLAVAAGCQSTATPAEPTPPAPADEAPLPVVIGSERVAAVSTNAMLAWRDGTAGHVTHSATVQGGAVRVTPYSFDGGRHANPALTLETAAVTVDGVAIASAVTGSRTEGATITLQRGTIEEQIENLPDGLEQRWRFAQPPTFDGDLVVEVAVSGQDYVATTDGGLHFRSSTGVGVRYSHATWIDANGQEFPIRGELANGRIRMTVSSEVLAASAFPAVLDPTIGAEIQLDNPIIATTGANTNNPSIAFDGTNFLVVWSDNRNSVDDDIFGARVSQAGAILDSLGLRISVQAGKQLHPVAASTGSGFVVAWEHQVTSTNSDIQAAAVSSAGAVTQLGTVAGTAANELTPKLAGRGGGQALLVWNGGGDILGSVFSGGAFGAAVPVAATAASEIDPAVAADPAGNYLVVWSEGAAATADLRGQLVTSAGAASGAAFNVSAGAGAQFNPSAAFDGTNFAVTWTNNNAGINIFGTGISTAGAVLNTHLEGMVTVGGATVSGAADNQELSQIACAGGTCTVIWQDRRNLATTGFDIMGQQLNADFTLNGAEFVVSNANLNQDAPTLASTGSGFRAAWRDGRSGNALQIFSATITGATAGTAANVVTGNNRELQPSVGRAQTNFGVFMADSRNDGDIQLTLFNANGAKLNATSISVSNAVFSQATPAASTDLGGNFYVVWSDSRSGATKDIFGARVSSTGSVLDAGGTAISQAAGNQLIPDIASNGTVALAVWQDSRNGNTDIFGALISSAGAVMVADIAIAVAAGNQTAPTVTFDSSSGQFLVVWSDARGATTQIFGTRVDTAGNVLDAAGVQVSSTTVGAFAPAISANAGNTMVVWDDRRNGGNRDIFGTRIIGGAALTVLDTTNLTIASGTPSQTVPSIANIGTSYIVVWTDDRNGNLDIFGQQITFAGALSGAEFVVSNGADDETNATITPSTVSGQARIAYQKAQPALDTIRVFTRTVASGAPTGQVCSNDGQCASGFCRDGFCCNTTCGGPNNLTDCQACSFAKTLQQNGVCSIIPAGIVCRNNANNFCDVREQCDGISLNCPADLGKNQGLVCNTTTGTVCPANDASGAPHACP